MKQSVAVIICAAGAGQRAGFSKNKLLTPFMGRTVLEQTLSAFDFPRIDEILITAAEQDFEEISALCAPLSRVKIVLGGETRMQSVYNALKETRSEIVLVHDGARPFATRELIEGCIESVLSFGSGICAMDAVDTVACVSGGKINSVPDRASLKHLQTPQGFFTENLRYAYERAMETGKTFTDESSVFAQFCGAPHVCAGSRANIKLTYAEDFERTCVRCGFGVDTHAFGKAQDFIMLGGVKIPSESGLKAHSDGDVLLHALMDALLSAAGRRDIGHYFPDTDERFKGADSKELLKQVLSMLKTDWYKPQNVSIAVQAEKPRLAGYIDEMKNSLSDLLDVDPTAIGITAGTNEGLGYVGEGKGITVSAYVLLQTAR